jgi:hypothetical protein
VITDFGRPWGASAPEGPERGAPRLSACAAGVLVAAGLAADDSEESAALDEPVASAAATGSAPIAEPTPNATASAPTRPT